MSKPTITQRNSNEFTFTYSFGTSVPKIKKGDKFTFEHREYTIATSYIGITDGKYTALVITTEK